MKGSCARQVAVSRSLQELHIECPSGINDLGEAKIRKLCRKIVNDIF